MSSGRTSGAASIGYDVAVIGDRCVAPVVTSFAPGTVNLCCSALRRG